MLSQFREIKSRKSFSILQYWWYCAYHSLYCTIPGILFEGAYCTYHRWYCAYCYLGDSRWLNPKEPMSQIRDISAFLHGQLSTLWHHTSTTEVLSLIRNSGVFWLPNTDGAVLSSWKLRWPNYNIPAYHGRCFEVAWLPTYIPPTDAPISTRYSKGMLLRNVWGSLTTPHRQYCLIILRWPKYLPTQTLLCYTQGLVAAYVCTVVSRAPTSILAYSPLLYYLWKHMW